MAEPTVLVRMAYVVFEKRVALSLPLFSTRFSRSFSFWVTNPDVKFALCFTHIERSICQVAELASCCGVDVLLDNWFI
jgi:hypothetical protein